MSKPIVAVFLISIGATTAAGANQQAGQFIVPSCCINGLYQVDATPGNSFNIIPYGYSTSYSANPLINQATQARSGGRIAFTSSFKNNNLGNRTYVMEGDGTNMRQLTFNNPNANTVGSDVSPAVSPDGSKVAVIYGEDIPTNQNCAVNEGGIFIGHAVYIINSDGSNPHKIYPQLYTVSNQGYCVDTGLSEVVWSPDGTKLLVRAGATITMLNADGSGPKEIFSENFVGYPITQGLDWSPDGTHIIVGTGYNNLTLRLFDINGGLIRDFTPLAGGQMWTTPGTAVRFSPDSQQIALLGIDGASQHRFAYFMDLNGNSTGTTDFNASYGISPESTGDSLWWSAGAPLGKPTTLTLAPPLIKLCPGHPVQFVATLYDSGGNHLTYSYASLTVNNGTTAFNSINVGGFGPHGFGLVTKVPGGWIDSDSYYISNAGIKSNTARWQTVADCSITMDFRGSGVSDALLYDPHIGQSYTALSNGSGS